ncbi:MAG: Maf family protein [Bacilli bacterium]|nr:Maf family protein [Bacilli bacterium]
MRIILASSSKQRQDIFKMIGLKYDVVTSNVDEVSVQKEPNKYVEELSLNKAKSVINQINDKLLSLRPTPLYIVIKKCMRNLKLRKKHILI